MNKASCVGLMCFGLLAMGVTVGGCGSGGNGGNSGTSSAPTALFTTWRLVAITGGISGGGAPVGSDIETLTFAKNGVVTRRINGQTASQRPYKVTRRKTSFSTEILPVVEYPDGSLAEVITQVDAQHLLLAEEATDAYNHQYERDTSSPE